MTTPTPDAGAAVYEPALRLRAEIRHYDGTARLARYRAEWPDLFTAADDIVGALDAADPPREVPRCGECEHCRA